MSSASYEEGASRRSECVRPVCEKLVVRHVPLMGHPYSGTAVSYRLSPPLQPGALNHVTLHNCESEGGGTKREGREVLREARYSVGARRRGGKRETPGGGRRATRSPAAGILLRSEWARSCARFTDVSARTAPPLDVCGHPWVLSSDRGPSLGTPRPDRPPRPADVTCGRHVRHAVRSRESAPTPSRDHHADLDAGMLLLVLAGVLASSCSGDPDLGTLVFANVLYRHGDRTPIEPYKNDPYRNESLWPVPFGQLTNIGKHQHLLLGRWLKKRYSGFLSDLYTPYEIYVQSTDVDRTLMSAEANLAGLYPPVKSEIWDNTIRWIPIPVHTIPVELDYVLKASKSCPRYKYELEKLLTSPEMERIRKANANLFAYLTEHSGDEISSFRAVEHLYDNLYIETLYNKTLPYWTRAVFPEKMKPLAIFSFMMEGYNKILQRLKSGPLLGEIIDHMVKKAQRTLKPDRKIWIYSAHDETVGNILMTLNLFEPHPPPYAATVLIELRTNSKNQYFVTVSYKNTTEEPMLMTLPGCATLCPLNEFINLTRDVIPEDWGRECLISRNDISSSDVIAILTSSTLMLVLLVLIIIGFMYWRHKREHRQYYFRLAYNGYNDAI